MTERVQSQMQASKMRFFETSKKLQCLANFITLQFDYVKDLYWNYLALQNRNVVCVGGLRGVGA